MASTNITFDILARDNASSKFDHLSRSVDHSSTAMGKLGSIAKTAAKAGIFAAGAGAVIAAKGLYEMGQAAAEDDKAARALALTLRNAAGATDAQIASTERWITAQGKALGVADDDLRPALQRLAEGTKDVGEAQRLASIAMDASAGTGKSLKTISEALLRAMNGSVGGLSRYGIATKNAKGETLTFEQVTAKMAKTFEGQASKAAETTAGKFARMKLALSEAGESIGYELLPYVSDAADWLGERLPGALDTVEKKAGPVFESIVDGAGDLIDAVKPAADEIVEAFGHLTKSGSGVGDMFHDDILPAVSATADAVGGLVNFVDELPGPVKHLGAEVAIAAVAFSALSGGIDKVKGSMPSLIGDTATATTRIQALQSAARTAAGIGGMLALVKGATESNKALGTLETTAGGAALGFSVGGPWGAAIGAVGGLALGLKDVLGPMRDLKAEAKAGATKWETYAGTLDDVSAALSTATRQMAYQSLQEKGLLTSAGQLGISQQTLLGGVLGHTRARDKLVAAMNREQAAIDEIVATRTHLADMEGRVYDPAADQEISARIRNLEAIRAEIGSIRKSVREKINEIAVTKRIPKRVVQEFFQQGVVKGIKDLRTLAHEYKLTPKQVRTIVKAANVDVTRKELARLIADLKETGRQKPEPPVDMDDRPFVAKNKRILNELHDLDAQQANPKTDLSLDEYYRKRAELIASLNNIPDEYVNIWTIRHDGGGGGGNSGGGADLSNPPSRILPDGVHRERTALVGAQRRASRVASVASVATAPRGGSSQPSVVVRFPERITLRVGHREFDAYVDERARIEIDQARTFEESQR